MLLIPNLNSHNGINTTFITVPIPEPSMTISHIWLGVNYILDSFAAQDPW